MLVAIEGADGSGKSTVAKAVAAQLGVGLQVFPDRTTPVGKLINQCLLGNVLLNDTRGPEYALMFQALQIANRVEHLKKLEAAAGGPFYKHSLILDRYWASGYVYGKLDGLDPDWLIEVHQNLPQASLNILLDVPPSVSAERIKARGGPPEHYERDEVLGKLRSNYHEVWGWGRQHQGEKRWQVVNGVGTREEVLGRVLDIVNRPIAL